MNLHAVASSVIAAVNPNVGCTIQKSIGYATNSDGSRVPQYENPFPALAQIQELSEKDLRHSDALNLQGTERSIYLSGWVRGAVRMSRLGGDLITLDSGDIYLTTRVVEQWPLWCRVIATQQNGS